MTADELRDLAASLSFGYCTDRAADYLRACVEAMAAGPVAWRVECRWADPSIDQTWRKYADYGTRKAAETSQRRFANPGDIESRVVPLYPVAMPAQTLRLPEPMTDSEISDYARATVKGGESVDWLIKKVERELLRRMKEANE